MPITDVTTLSVVNAFSTTVEAEAKMPHSQVFKKAGSKKAGFKGQGS